MTKLWTDIQYAAPFMFSSGLTRLWIPIASLCAIFFIFSLTLRVEHNLLPGNFPSSKLYEGFANSSFTTLRKALGLSGGFNKTQFLKKIDQFASGKFEKLKSDDKKINEFLQFQFYDSIWGQGTKDKSISNVTGAFVNKQFLVDTAGCKIPDFNPFHPSVLVHINNSEKPPKEVCKSLPKDLTSSRKNILYYNPDNLFSNSTPVSQNQVEKIQKSLKCCYRSIESVTQKGNIKLNRSSDGRYRFGEECYPITKEQTIINHDSIVVTCSSTTKIVYTNVHHFIKKKNFTLSSNIQESEDNDSICRKEYNINLNSSSQDNLRAKENDSQIQDKLNVIIFGTDTISRLNFIRKLPKSYSYLMKNLDALEFKGFNKHADNTFPNLVPILTGLSREQLNNHSCLSINGSKYDKCPWIWKEFKKNGYVTAFMEDSPWNGIFHFGRPGFLCPPTDYYGRPYLLASEHLIGRYVIGTSNVCQGNKLSLEVLHDYSLELMEAYPSDPTFSMFWSFSLTHDFVNFASKADEPHLSYLKSLEESGALNRSVLLFMSDHGIRYGKMRQTQIGAFEDRLPFMSMVFPKWFRRRYPAAYSNLKRNTERLTSNFDIHKTLLDLANDKYKDKDYIASYTDSISKGISLFKEIPGNRSCNDAGIPQHYCTCQEMNVIDKNDESVLKGRNYIVDFINNELKLYSNCNSFTNVTVIQSHISIWSGQEKTSYSRSLEPPFRTLFLQLKLDPGNALIEATIQADTFLLKYKPHSFQILGEISRINQYGNQSHCISHDILRKFCICKDTL